MNQRNPNRPLTSDTDESHPVATGVGAAAGGVAGGLAGGAAAGAAVGGMTGPVGAAVGAVIGSPSSQSSRPMPMTRAVHFPIGWSFGHGPW